MILHNPTTRADDDAKRRAAPVAVTAVITPRGEM
jgi:hypothetical protein